MDRTAYHDNARLALVALVVIGHALRPIMGDDGAARALYVWIYWFHVPMLALLAGAFSRDGYARDARAGIARLVIPYTIFEVLYWGERVAFGFGSDELTLLDPYWLLWFIVALFFWRLSLPLVLRLRHPLIAMTAAAILLGLVSTPLRALALSRFIVFYPFFLAGALAGPDRIARLARVRPRRIGWVVLAASALAAAALAPNINVEWLYGNHSYAEDGLNAANGPLVRMSMYAAGFLVGAAFLAVVPRRRHAVTALGARTIYPYLLHGFVVKWLGAAGVLVQGRTELIVPVVLGGGALAIALATSPVVRATRTLVEPAWAVRWLGVRRSTGPLRGDRRAA